MIERVIRQLEVAERAIDVTLDANSGLRDKLFAVPVPEKDLPVRATCERHDHALFLRAECARHEFLRLKRIHVLNLLGQRLSFLKGGDIVDAELALVACGAALADSDVLLALGEGDVGDCLSVI